MKKVLLLFYLVLFSASIFAQSIDIKGKVVDATDGTSIPSVTIIEKGTTNGGITDLDGNFNIKVASDQSILVFNFVGFKKQEIKVAGQRNMKVLLEAEMIGLDEVVAIGYSNSKRKELTGAISSVDMKELKKAPVANISEALSGRISGLQVARADGQPGANIYFTVRGGNSITQDNSPLIIVDGFPGGDISTIDMNDVESIDVLRDAASTAIYGARGANGVILITTKSAQEGAIQVTYNGFVSTKKIDKTVDLMNPLQYTQLQYEIWGNSEDEDTHNSFVTKFGEWDELEKIYGNREGVDWIQEVFGKPTITHNHSLNLSGGTKRSAYNVVLNHVDNEGIQINSGYTRDLVKFKLNSEVNKRLTISTDIGYTLDQIKGAGTSDNLAGGNYMKIIRYRPTIGKEGQDKELLDLTIDPFMVDDELNATEVNPVLSAKSDQKKRVRRTFYVNGSANYKIMDNLTYNVRGSYRHSNTQTKRFFTENYPNVLNYEKFPYGYVSNGEGSSVLLNHTLNYNTLIEEHSIGVMLGQEYIANESYSFTANAKGFANDDIGLNDLSAGSIPVTNASNYGDNTNVSYFGRLSYNYKQRYLLNATYRVDGCSKFGENHKYGFFPAASFAWRVNEENFMAGLPQVSNLKLRLSYGTSGNNGISNYLSLPLYQSVKYAYSNNETVGYITKMIPNPDLKWETTISRNVGLDVGLFKQRVQLTADAFISNTKDLLLNAEVPYTTGVGTIMTNIGETKNKGLEVNLTTRNIVTSDFSWTTNFNISFVKNEVVDLANGQDYFEKLVGYGGVKVNNYLVKVGEPVGLIYGYKYDRLYMPDDFDGCVNANKWNPKADVPYLSSGNKPGDIKYQDISGENGEPDGVIDEYDRVVIGNPNPDHFGGIINTFNYKNWDLSVACNWSYGNDIYNAFQLPLMAPSKYRNTAAFMADRYLTINEAGENIATNPEELTRVNKDAKYPGYNNTWGKAVTYDKIIEDGSYFRINNITLGYQLPKLILNKIGVQKVRVYGTIANVATWTNYSGVNPEVNTMGRGITKGVDSGGYPMAKSYVFGLNVTF